MTHVQCASPGEAVAEANRVCANGPVMNLTISFNMELPASTDGLLATYREDASSWQQKSRPTTLHFNHGEFMHAHGDWLAFVVQELNRKPTSNRACVSLVDSASIFDSGDGALPSFMLLQVGFDGPARDNLYVTAYYRALEVTAFLPLNVAEMALIAEAIADRLVSIERATVNMYAFRAHSNPGFEAHKRSDLDRADATQIQEMVKESQREKIASLLEEKAAPASIIDESGLAILRNEIGLAGWAKELLDEMDRAVSALARLGIMRTAGTHGNRIQDLQKELTNYLLRCAELVRDE